MGIVKARMKEKVKKIQNKKWRGKSMRKKQKILTFSA